MILDKSGVLALIPAWNEANRIGSVIRALPQGMAVLVVDDGSSDETLARAAAAGAQTLAHGSNRGKGIALMTGFEWALEKEYAAVLTLDADGQHDPQEAQKFIEAYNQQEDGLIIGTRSTRAMPFPRNLANRFSSWLLSRILGVEIRDNQSGYRLHSRGFIEQLEVRRSGFEFEVDVILQAIEHGVGIGWVNIRTIYDSAIKSHFHPLRDSLKFFSVAWYAFRSRRRPGLG